MSTRGVHARPAPLYPVDSAGLRRPTSMQGPPVAWGNTPEEKRASVEAQVAAADTPLQADPMGEAVLLGLTGAGAAGLQRVARAARAPRPPTNRPPDDLPPLPPATEPPMAPGPRSIPPMESMPPVPSNRVWDTLEPLPPPVNTPRLTPPQLTPPQMAPTKTYSMPPLPEPTEAVTRGSQLPSLPGPQYQTAPGVRQIAQPWQLDPRAPPEWAEANGAASAGYQAAARQARGLGIDTMSNTWREELLKQAGVVVPDNRFTPTSQMRGPPPRQVPTTQQGATPLIRRPRPS